MARLVKPDAEDDNVVRLEAISTYYEALPPNERVGPMRINSSPFGEPYFFTSSQNPDDRDRKEAFVMHNKRRACKKRRRCFLTAIPDAANGLHIAALEDAPELVKVARYDRAQVEYTHLLRRLYTRLQFALYQQMEAYLDSEGWTLFLVPEAHERWAPIHQDVTVRFIRDMLACGGKYVVRLSCRGGPLSEPLTADWPTPEACLHAHIMNVSLAA